MNEERKIIIGLITSTEFIKRIQDRFTAHLLEAAAAKRIAGWCMEYFEKYDQAPLQQIENIFYAKVKDGLQKDIAQEIEEEILPDLSEEYEKEGMNVDYMVDVAIKYLNERHLTIHHEQGLALVKQGKAIEAESHASNYKPVAKDSGTWIDLSEQTVLDKVEKAFNRTTECLIRYPGALGQFWNDQLVRGGFVAMLAPEKRGKTFLMIDMAMRAARQKKRVAFFEAGDMNEDQLLKRICIYLAKKSDKEKYAGLIYEPVKDCIKNQNDSCDLDLRESNFGPFQGMDGKEIRSTISVKDLKIALKEHKDYKPCYNCLDFNSNKWGVPWLRNIDLGEPLEVVEAQRLIHEFFIKYGRQFKVSTHPSGTLTVKQSLAILDIWQKQDNFVPDIIFYDYPDIMTDEHEKDHRTKQNKIWMDLRGVSDKRHCLTIAVTQADANSYTHDLLKLENFSEDKRKYAHVTAMYGLNQDHKGREKEIGIMRINELVVREGDFSINNQVYVLQNLKRGRPFLTSYW